MKNISCQSWIHRHYFYQLESEKEEPLNCLNFETQFEFEITDCKLTRF